MDTPLINQVPQDPDNPEPKHDYQGNREVFDMPENQKPKGTALSIPFGKIGLVIAGVVLAAFVILAIVSMLNNSGSFL